MLARLGSPVPPSILEGETGGYYWLRASWRFHGTITLVEWWGNRAVSNSMRAIIPLPSATEADRIVYHMFAGFVPGDGA